ncbi:hypothetical protein C8R47DRAFT_1297655 [Mycena vitilis]|nr:hypothetical protein C8R47DRAFT_1297655 [Mycena vitilis]
MSAPARRRRVTQQPQLVPQEEAPPAAADDDQPVAEQGKKSPTRTRKGRGKKNKDDEDFDEPDDEQQSGSDEGEPLKKKPKTTTAPKPKGGGRKKNTGETESPAKPKAPPKTPAKRATTAAAKPVAIAKAGPAVSAHVNIASDARAEQWRADLDLAAAHRKIATEEAKADFYLTATELGSRLITLVDLYTVDTLATLRSKGVLGKTQTIPRFDLPPPPDAPPLPGPFESIWLLGKILRSPLETSASPVEGSGAEAGPSTAGATTTSTMLTGSPALVADETPGSPSQAREEEDGS